MDHQTPAHSTQKIEGGDLKRFTPSQREAQLWSVMKRSLPEEISHDRVEATLPVGIPDVLWRIRGTNQSGWLELKDQDLLLRPEQRILGRRWATDGVNILVCGRRGDFLYLIDPREVPINCRVDFKKARPPEYKSRSTFFRMPETKGQWHEIWRFITEYRL